MQLHEDFVRIARQYGGKIAINDRSTGRQVSYSKALIASLILANKFKKYHDGFIGIMIPTSAGCMLSVLGVLMAGKVPVMINYSTGAAGNAEYAQKKCGFKTIITSKALLEKIGCRLVPGMVFIEDIMAEHRRPLDKLEAALQAKLPLTLLLKSVHQGDPDDNVVILFTSGSEKDPKAVQLTHRNIGSNVEDIAQGPVPVPGRHHAGQPAALSRLRPQHRFLAAAAHRHDRCHLCQPAGVQEDLHDRARGKGHPDGRHADLLFRLPAPVGRPAILPRCASPWPGPTSAPTRCAADSWKSTAWSCARATAPPKPARWCPSTPCPGANKPGSIGMVLPSVQVQDRRHQHRRIAAAGK